jgi:hypothetical protein
MRSNTERARQTDGCVLRSRFEKTAPAGRRTLLVVILLAVLFLSFF